MALDARIGRLAETLRQDGYDAYFAHHPVSLKYLSGFSEDFHERFGMLAIHQDGRSHLICPALSETAAREHGLEQVSSWRDGEDPREHFRALVNDWGLRAGMVAVDDTLPSVMLLRMQELAPAMLFRPGGEVLGAMRAVKEDGELEKLRKAARIADETYHEVLPQIRLGMTELDVKALLEASMAKRGGRPQFAIVAVGAAAAEPHHGSDETRLKSGQVLLMDFGCELEGYQSDITRCVHLGPAPEKVKTVYRTVHQGFMAGRAAIQPGAACQDTDRAARKVIAEAGFGEYFVHRLGHGLGMQGHESPNQVEGNTAPLVPGNVFSVEPGIYLPGEFGIRIENIVAATMSGHESLNEEPPAEIPELMLAVSDA
jgi:Xaa-Pro dipeptidase